MPRPVGIGTQPQNDFTGAATSSANYSPRSDFAEAHNNLAGDVQTGDLSAAEKEFSAL